MMLCSLTLNVNANVTDEEWIPFSFDKTNFSYKNVFRSNDTFGYQLTLEVNLTHLDNGTFNIRYQTGDVFNSIPYTSKGNYTYQVETLSLSIALNGYNASASGFYRLSVGNRVSLSPWGYINLLFLFSLFGLIILSGVGIPPIISVLVILVAILGLFGSFVYFSIKSIKTWKRKRTAKSRSYMIVKLAIFSLISLILLFPFRFSFF